MQTSRKPLSRNAVVSWAVLVFSMFCAASSSALQPTTRLTQYAHKVWRIGDDGLLGTPQSVAQTADGYVWVATSNGLFRFDGKHFAKWAPTIGRPLPSSSTWYLYGARNGSLYVGTDRGLFRIKGGRVNAYPGSPRWPGPFVEDGQDNVWMGVSGVHSDPNAICKIGVSNLECFGSHEGFPCTRGLSNTIDLEGNLWIGSEEGICRWDPRSKAPVNLLLDLRHPQTMHSITSMATDVYGQLWAGTRAKGQGAGLLHYEGGRWSSYISGSIDGRTLRVSTLLAERNGPVWIGTTDNGIYRISSGHLDHFDTLNGLSNRNILSIFEDHEGGVWVATPTGVDFFRDYAVLSFTSSEGSEADHANAVTVDDKGFVYLGSSSLTRLSGWNLVRLKNEHGAPFKDVRFLFTDSHGKVWVGSANDLTVLGDGGHQATAIQGYPHLGNEYISYIAEDAKHDIWVSLENLPARHSSLLRIRNGRVIGRYEAASMLGNQVINALAPNPAGGLWVGGSAHGLFWFHEGVFERVGADGFDDRVENMMSELDGTLWLVTPHGFIRYAESKAETLTVRNGFPCDDGVNIQDDGRGNKWFYTHCGIFKISDTDLAAWWSNPEALVHQTPFDALQGARPNLSNGSPSQTPDGDLWSANDYAFQVIRSNSLPFNSLPPPVTLQRVIADGEEFAPDHDLDLPVHTRQIEIQYAGLSYLIPDLVRFRYRLENQDANWVEAGNRREVFLTDLRPGHYVFQVIACNNDGVWNLQGARLAFNVPPAWYQTLLFRVSATLFALGVIVVSYVYRLRRFAASLNLHFDARLQERTRLARDLHDTLLQTIQGSKLVADSARDQVNDPILTARTLDRLSDWLERASLEGRAALEALRTSSSDSSDLSESLRQVADDCVTREQIKVLISVTGQVRELHPIARDEVYRIGYEAIRNACAHSGALELRIELFYGRRFRLLVRDNGAGIADAILSNGKAGHFGLEGMRERALAVGGKLNISSSEKNGTAVSVLVPGDIMYKRVGRETKPRFRKPLGF